MGRIDNGRLVTRMGLLKKLCKNRKATSTTLVAVIVVAAVITVLVAQRPPWEGTPTPTTTTTTTAPTTTTTETTTPTTTQPTGTENLIVLPESSLQSGVNHYKFVLENTGTGDSSITLIKLGGTDVTNLRAGGIADYPIPVKAGTQITITGIARGSYEEGESYEIVIYTARGNTYSGAIIAEREEPVM